MRLLQILSEGGFHLIERIGNDIPPYAILSHTWGNDDDEVTLQDLKTDTGNTKAGYCKLQFCRQQAVQDGLKFIWMDTCCIDKSSSAELTEAINSMFRWYQAAARCYVYLSDVSVSTSAHLQPAPQSEWYPDFRNSRWFTRGWTLQELIAARSVEFFSAEGEKLADKVALKYNIHEITGIPIGALEGGPMSDYSIDERLCWAKGRETRREEDAAYCLLGIFDVCMPLIYGEDRKSAFRRLFKEVRDLANDQPRSYPLKSRRPQVSKPWSHAFLDASPIDNYYPVDQRSISKVPMWPGNVIRTKFTFSYQESRDVLTNATYYGRWDQVLGLLDGAPEDQGENWSNAVRLKYPHEVRKLSFWTPLHQAAYLRAPISVIKGLIDRGSLRTFRTRYTDEHEFKNRDLTAVEIARAKGYHHLIGILAPVIYHTIPPRKLARLQALFHEIIRADWDEVEDLILPDLIALTELVVPEMWFPVGVQREAGPLVGYRYKLDDRELVVTKLGIQNQESSVYRIR